MGITPCRRVAVYLIFILSGFCALVYELLWTKYLSLTFGTTMAAVSTVAAIFMGGLALGSYLLGRYADREKNLLKVYALLEFGIAVTALAFAPTLSLVESFYVWWAGNYPQYPLVSGCFRFLLPALLLLPPTVCMGGTFPLMCRFFARKKCGGQIGRLYALNTLGATCGAFCSGYLLIPTIGLSATGYLAAGGNLLAGAVALVLASRHGAADADGLRPEVVKDSFLKPQRHRLTMISVGLIGFFALAYEILWTRLLLLFLGNTSYAFALILSAYLVGIAIGGALYARLVHAEMNEKRLFVALTGLMALSVLASVPFYDQLAELFQFAHNVSGERWWHLSLLSFLLVFGVIGLPTVLSGALLPAAVAIADPGKRHTGEGVGAVVLHNTVGAMLGALAAGFLLIPWFGLQGSFIALGVLNLLLALVLFVRFGILKLHPVSMPAFFALGLALAFVPLRWDPVLLTSGVYCYAPKYRMMGGILNVVGKDPLLALLEGPETTVGIHETSDRKVRYFTVNGKTDGGTGADMKTQVLIGDLPMLIHPEPKDIFVLGLGTGITLGRVTQHAARRIDCAEISPEVVKASLYFASVNGRPLADPRVQLHVEDGRNLLLTRSDRYDIIVSQPSNPWQSGNASLFTADFYRTAAARLNPGGLFTQWIGLYDMTSDNLRIACRTFMETFPHVMVFKESADLILVGATEEFAIDYRIMQSRLANLGVRPGLASIGIGSVGDLIAHHYLYDSNCLAPFAAAAVTLNTDDRPILEYSAHHNLGMKTLGAFAQQNMTALLQALRREMLPIANLGTSAEEVASALRDLGLGFRRAGKEADALQFLREADKLDGMPGG